MLECSAVQSCWGDGAGEYGPSASANIDLPPPELGNLPEIAKVWLSPETRTPIHMQAVGIYDCAAV